MGATDKTFVDDSLPDLEAADLNGYNLEQKNLIEDSEQVFDDTDREQSSKAVSNLVAKGGFRGDSGIADAYVLEPTGNQKRVTALMNGQSFIFQVGNTNTGASTVAVDGLTAKAIKDEAGNNLSAGDLTQYDYVKIIYDSSNDWFILSINFTLYSSVIDSTKNTLLVTKSTNYVITDTDRVRTVLIDTAGVAITLPSAANNIYRIITITKIVSTNTASQITGTINGVSNPDLDFQYESITAQSDGTNWNLINHYIPEIWYSLTVTGANWTTVSDVTTARFIKSLAGVWSADLMIVGTLSAGAANLTLTVTGMTFKAATNGNQPMTSAYNDRGLNSYVNQNANTIFIEKAAGGVTTVFNAAGIVKLNAKPTIVL